MLQNLNLGASANDKSGTPARAAGQIINSNFNFLEGKIDNLNVILVEAGYILVGNVLTMNAGWQWKINGVTYTNPASVAFTIPYAAAGNKRLDAIIMNTSNTFARITGTETTGNPVTPVAIAQTIKLYFFNVSDAAVFNTASSVPFLGTITTTSTPTGSGPAFWRATQSGTYTNFGGFVVAANSLAEFGRDAAGVFSMSQTALDISSKVNVSDIINNLTSTETAKPLSANQGRISTYLKLDSSIYKNDGLYSEITGYFTESVNWDFTDLLPVIVGRTIKFIDTVNGVREFSPVYFKEDGSFISSEHEVLQSVVPALSFFVGINISNATAISDRGNCYIEGINAQEATNIAKVFQSKKNTAFNLVDKHLLGIVPIQKVNIIESVCKNNGYITIVAGVYTVNATSSWKYSDLLPISELGSLKTYLDSNNKPAISFFSANNLGSFISGIFTTPDTFYNSNVTDIVVPVNATHFSIQYLFSQLGNCFFYTPKIGEIDKEISAINDKIININNAVINYEVVPLNTLVTTEGWYSIAGGVVTLNASTAWRRTSLLPIALINGALKTYIDTTDKAAISYFSAGNIASYISSQYNATADSFFNAVPTIPANATHFMTQCVNSQIATATLSIKESKIPTASDDFFFDVTKNSDRVAGDLWTLAIQSALNDNNNVYIPYKATPYLIDGTLVIKSGTHLLIHPQVTIKATTNACMLRNQNLLSATFDEHITLEGGHFNQDGFLGEIAIGTATCIGFLGVNNLTIKNLKVSNTGQFGIQVNSSRYLNVSDIVFDIQASDGLHMGGDISEFHIENISGEVGDDMVALNAWDWLYSTPRTGTIQNGIIRNIFGYAHAHMIRLLGAVEDGVIRKVDNIIIDNVKGQGGLSILDIGYQEEPYANPTVTSATKIGNIKISNVEGWCTNDMAIKISSDIESLELNNCLVSSKTGFGIIQLPNTTIDSLIIDRYNYTDATAESLTKCKMSFQGTVKNFVFKNAYIKTTDTTNDLFALYNVLNFVVDSNFIEGFNRLINLPAFNTVNAKFINNLITVNTSVIGMQTSGNSAKFKLLANDFSGSGFVLNNGIAGFTPIVKSVMNTRTTISQSNGLVTWEEII